MVQRTRRSAEVSSPLALLAEFDPVHHALTREMARLAIGGPHYQALDRMSDAIHRLAADLGHPGRFVGQPPGVNRG